MKLAYMMSISEAVREDHLHGGVCVGKLMGPTKTATITLFRSLEAAGLLLKIQKVYELHV